MTPFDVLEKFIVVQLNRRGNEMNPDEPSKCLGLRNGGKSQPSIGTQERSR